MGAEMTGRGWRLAAVIFITMLAASLPWAAVAESIRLPAGPQIELRNGELSLLARVVQAESANQPMAGQRAVAWTAVNRLRAGTYGKTLSQVLLARHQYARPKPLNSTSPAYRTALMAALMATRGTLPDDSRGATHFHACAMKRRPAWAARLKPTIRISSHCFYRLKEPQS